MKPRRHLVALGALGLLAVPAVPALARSGDDASAIARLTPTQIIEVDWRPSTRHLRSISVDFRCPGSKDVYTASKTVALGTLPVNGKLNRTFRAAFKATPGGEGTRTGTAEVTLAATVPLVDDGVFRGTVTVTAPDCKGAKRRFKGKTDVSVS